MGNDIEQRALAILAETLGRTKEQMGDPEPDAYVTEVEAVRAIAAAIRQRPVVDDARMARALEWLRAIAECSEDPADKPHIEAIEEAISAYQQNNGDQKR